MSILRTVPTTLSLADLEGQLNDFEAALTVDGQQIKARLLSIGASTAKTPQSPDVPVVINLVDFDPATAGEGLLQLVDRVPSTDTPDERQAFFDNLDQSTLTIVCFSNVLIEGQSEEVVTCRALAQGGVVSAPAAAGKVLPGDGTWPFTAQIVGNDIVVRNIVITCFGGNGDGTNSDPQDDGKTASGANTNDNPIDGVSIAMDGRQFPGFDRDGHAALDGAPIPRLLKNGQTAWGTLVEVTIGLRVYTPVNGIVDLGPAKGASQPGEPHALDLTTTAVGHFAPNIPLDERANTFSARGSFRIIGGANLIS